MARPVLTFYTQPPRGGVTELFACCFCGEQVIEGLVAPRYMGGFSRKTILCLNCIRQAIDVVAQHDVEAMP